MSKTLTGCYWCGAPRTSDEHVPPRSLFGNRANRNLVTVPSCKRHNEDFHLIDERFRVFLQSSSSSQTAEDLFADKTLRGLTRRTGLLQSLKDASRPGRLNGVDTLAIHVPGEHHDPYFEKIARGLYFHHFQKPYTGELRSVCSHFHSPHLDFRELIKLYHSVKSSLEPGTKTDDRIFQYEIGRAIEPGGEGLFFRLTFYTDITVFCVGTPRPGLLERIRRTLRYWIYRVSLRLQGSSKDREYAKSQ